MKVYFIGAGPGDPDLITVRGRDILAGTRVCVYAGSLVNPALLSILPEGAEVHDSSSMTLEDMGGVYTDARDRGLDVARLHTGDLSLYSAMHEQALLLGELGIKFEVVPGVSSFQAAAAVLKRELTVPQVSQTVILTRMEGRTPVPEGESLDRLARSGATLCIFLSAGMMDRVVEAVSTHYPPSTPAAVVYRASWPDQRVVTGTLADIAGKAEEAGMERQSMILIGSALGGHFTRSKLYDRSFGHGFREEAE